MAAEDAVVNLGLIVTTLIGSAIALAIVAGGYATARSSAPRQKKLITGDRQRWTSATENGESDMNGAPL